MPRPPTPLACADPEDLPLRPPRQPRPFTLSEHRRFMVGLAQHLGRGRIDPEDLAQDVFERWLRSTPHAGITSSPGAIENPQAWMALVLRRLLIDRLRRRHRAREVLVRTAATAPAATEPDSAPWWCELDAGTIQHELSSLPPVLRQTFQLFTFEDRSYAQIARDLKIAPATVGTRISRARALLRERLIARVGAPTTGPRS